MNYYVGSGLVTYPGLLGASDNVSVIRGDHTGYNYCRTRIYTKTTNLHPFFFIHDDESGEIEIYTDSTLRIGTTKNVGVTITLKDFPDAVEAHVLVVVEFFSCCEQSVLSLPADKVLDDMTIETFY